MSAGVGEIEIGKTCFNDLYNKRWELDYYQRPYTWLIHAIDSVIFRNIVYVFNSQYNSSHTAETRKGYTTAFLGDVIYTTQPILIDGVLSTRNCIVDGQQRLRSVQLLLIVLHVLYPNIGLAEYVATFKNAFTGKVPTIFDAETNDTVLKLLAGETPDECVSSESITNLLENYNHILETFKALDWDEEKVKAFVGWLLFGVQIGFKECRPEDAALVFIQHNTGNSNLRQHEILKALTIKQLPDDDQRAAFDKVWTEGNKVLRVKYGRTVPNIESDWRDALRGLIATETGTAKDKDFDILATHYGEYVAENLEECGLDTPEKAHYFATSVVPQIFKTLEIIFEEQEKKANKDSIIKISNAVRLATLFGGNYFLPILLSAVKVGDDEKTIRDKINLIAYAYLWVTLQYVIRRKPRGAGKMRPLAVEFILAVRGKSLEQMSVTLKKVVKRALKDIDKECEKFSGAIYRSEISDGAAFFIIQLVSHLWSELAGEDTDRYWNTDKTDSRYATLEHLIVAVWSLYEKLGIFANEQDHLRQREATGMMGIISKSTNSQLKDTHISVKAALYASEGGAWLRMLFPEFYNSKGEPLNTKVRAFVQENSQFVLTPMENPDRFNSDFIAYRNTLVVKSVDYIFSFDGFDRILEAADITKDAGIASGLVQVEVNEPRVSAKTIEESDTSN